MKKIILKNATVYVGRNEKKLTNMDIEIIDGKITRIEKDILDDKLRYIDCTDRFVTPGLINMHAHLFSNGLPKESLGTSKAQKRLMRIIKSPLGILLTRFVALKDARMALMGGITTMRTSGDLRYCDVWLRNKKYDDVPRLIVPGYAITSNTGHGHGTFALTSDNPNELRKLVLKNVKKGVDYIKTCTTGGVMDSTKKGDPGEVKVTEEQLKAIVDEAHLNGLKVASHTESPEGVTLDVKCGVDFIEHGSLFDDKLAKKMLENHTAITLTLSPSIAFVELPAKDTKCGELAAYNGIVVTNNSITGAKKAIENDVPIALGTDAACPFAFHHLAYREMLYANKMIGIKPIKALEMMTYGNAKLLGLDNEIGSIEVGKVADMLILGKDPMEDIDNFYDLDVIIHNGVTFKQKKFFEFEAYEKKMKKFKCLEEYPLPND